MSCSAELSTEHLDISESLMLSASSNLFTLITLLFLFTRLKHKTKYLCENIFQEFSCQFMATSDEEGCLFLALELYKKSPEYEYEYLTGDFTKIKLTAPLVSKHYYLPTTSEKLQSLHLVCRVNLK